MQPKVLEIIARMNIGGTARYIGKLVENIEGTKLVTGYVQGNEVEDGCVSNTTTIRVKQLGRKISILNDFKSWVELNKIIKKEKPDIVHTHTFKAGLIGRLALGRHKRIHTFHGHLFDDPSFSKFQKTIIRISEKLLAMRTDTLISVGDKVGLEIRELGIGANRHWVSIPPGVEPLQSHPKKFARKSLGLPESGILIGWMARVTAVKNPFLYVQIAENFPNLNFAMAGGGDLFDQILEAKPDNLIVMGWVDASLFLSSIDIAISTSENEGMPISLIEAQQMGLPVIATDVGSVSEVIENEVTGLIVSKHGNEIISALSKLIENNDLIKKFGDSAKIKSLSNFSQEKLISKHKKIYREIIENNHFKDIDNWT